MASTAELAANELQGTGIAGDGPLRPRHGDRFLYVASNSIGASVLDTIKRLIWVDSQCWEL